MIYSKPQFPILTYPLSFSIAVTSYYYIHTKANHRLLSLSLTEIQVNCIQVIQAVNYIHLRAVIEAQSYLGKPRT